MCCCGDGVDSLHADKNGAKRGRKTRKMPNNILGYNLTRGSLHRIHLRLRDPRNHGQFYSYDEIAGTMCHELAHCEVGPHNANFYKIMDEIQEQYAVYLVSGIVKDKDGFPLHSNQSYILGGKRSTSTLTAAENRRIKSKLGGTFVLGHGVVQNGDDKASLKHLPPTEAARTAAERRIKERQQNDSKVCLPCQDIIEILDCSSSDDEEEGVAKGVDGELSPAVMPAKNNFNREVIVLDDSSSDEDVDESQMKPACTEYLRYDNDISSWTCHACTYLNESHCDTCFMCEKTKFQSTRSVISTVEASVWGCILCTFENPSDNLLCDMCRSERHNVNHKTTQVVKEILQNNISERISASEAQRSIIQFNGFNIYANEKRNTGTLHHLT